MNEKIREAIKAIKEKLGFDLGPAVEINSWCGDTESGFYTEYDIDMDALNVEIDRFQAELAARATPAQPVLVKWPVALREAVAALYFDDSSDYKTALYAVVRNLSPDISALIESDDRADHSRAYSQVSVHYEEQPDGTITPVDPSDYSAPSPSSVGAAIAEPAPEKVEWSYSTNGENYCGNEESREDAIALALEEIGETEGTFWIGKNKRFTGRGKGCSSLVIEALQEQAYEDCGEFSETYLDDVTKEEEVELADFITDWAVRVDRSNFWTVYDTEQIDIAEVLAAPSIAQDGQKSEGA